MHNFSYYLPTRFVFGRGAEEQAGEMTRQAGGTHALIHYGGGSALRSGLIGKVEDSLQKAGVRYALLGGAQPNPLASKVYEGIRLIREEKIDFIIKLEHWNQDKVYDRLGLEQETTNILGLDIPTNTIPVQPGRNLAIIIEIAAMESRQKRMGYNTAVEFNKSLTEHLRAQAEANKKN